LRAVIIGMVLILNGCAVSVGLTYIPHDTEIEQPLGVIRGEAQFSEHFSGACEHISSAFMPDDVINLDHCGLFYTF